MNYAIEIWDILGGILDSHFSALAPVRQLLQEMQRSASRIPRHSRKSAVYLGSRWLTWARVRKAASTAPERSED
jgi:hypothetical protein